MRAYRISCAVLCLVGFLLSAGPAGAQTTNVATFSGPVQLPGVLLPRGNYTFAVDRDRRNVVVSDAEHRVVTIAQVVPISRDAPGLTITMRPAVGTAAPEIAALYTSGGTDGVEFMYRGRRVK